LSCDSILVLGLGNRLLRDDGAGPLVIDLLCAGNGGDSDHDCVRFRDGGTVGPSLLAEIEKAGALIAVDAARFGGAPGRVHTFEGAAMDRQLGRHGQSAHEVALFDLLAAAALRKVLPARRALVAVEPQDTSAGTTPSGVVAAAIPRMRAEVEALLARWRP